MFVDLKVGAARFEKLFKDCQPFASMRPFQTVKVQVNEYLKLHETKSSLARKARR